MSEFSAIPVFVEVVKQGGFSAAARSLGISKAAVSKRVLQLEANLGVRLLHRTTRKISLTEAGERYFVHARKALAAANEAEDAVTELQGEPRGVLRINVPMSFGRLQIAPMIPLFAERYPQLGIELVMDDRRVDLVEGGFDAAIRIGDLPDSSLIARKLTRCRILICASPAYIARYGQPTSPQDLVNHHCITYSYAEDGSDWTLTGKGGTQRIAVTGKYKANNGEALIELAKGGLGIGRFPSFIAGPHLQNGDLVPLLKDYSVQEKFVYAVFPERAYLPAKVRVFLDFAVEYFGGENPRWDSEALCGYRF